MATARTAKKCALNKLIFSEKGTPQLVIGDSLCVWVPVRFSGINQSSQRNSLVPLISWFYYFPDSQGCFTLPPSFPFVPISSKAKGGAFFFFFFFPASLSPLHHCRALFMQERLFHQENSQPGPVTPRPDILCAFIPFQNKLLHYLFIPPPPHTTVLLMSRMTVGGGHVALESVTLTNVFQRTCCCV